jgi:hypothetical protein
MPFNTRSTIVNLPTTKRTPRRVPVPSAQCGGVSGFAELTVANELGVLARAPALAIAHSSKLAQLCKTWIPLLSPRARQALNLS